MKPVTGVKYIGQISYNMNSIHMNYGAALHSYAFQIYLKKFLGKNSIIINYHPRQLGRYNIKYPALNNLDIVSIRGFLRHQLDWGLSTFGNIRKFNKFNRFFDKYTVTTSNKYYQEDLISLTELEEIEFEAFVSESDVIWKTYHNISFDEVFFLNIPIAENLPKIAYSPSIGSKKFSEEEIQLFKRLVSSYKGISLRERIGAEYVSKILERDDIEWLIDPTLLLTEEDYEEIEILPVEKDYLLIYNCMVNDGQMIRLAHEFAKQNNLSVIEISCFAGNRLRFGHKVKYDVGIEEFLGYFHNAKFVFCNAFHGCCFSNIYKKEFFLFQRDDSDYRMKNITEALGENQRLIPHDNKKLPYKIKQIDWKRVDMLMNGYRQKAYEFLKKNLTE